MLILIALHGQTQFGRMAIVTIPIKHDTMSSNKIATKLEVESIVLVPNYSQYCLSLHVNDHAGGNIICDAKGQPCSCLQYTSEVYFQIRRFG